MSETADQQTERRRCVRQMSLIAAGALRGRRRSTTISASAHTDRLRVVVSRIYSSLLKRFTQLSSRQQFNSHAS